MNPLILVLLIFATSAVAQSSPAPAVSQGSEQKTCALLGFEKELRDAVSKEDVGRIALLADYPLRVNDGRGSFYIHDPASLFGHFREIFTPTVRNAILRNFAIAKT